MGLWTDNEINVRHNVEYFPVPESRGGIIIFNIIAWKGRYPMSFVMGVGTSKLTLPGT